MIILNFSHPLTPEHLAQIEALTGQSVERVIEIPTHLDTEAPFGPQIAELVERAGLSPAEWQTIPLLVVPPALNFAAVLLMAEAAWPHGVLPPVRPHQTRPRRPAPLCRGGDSGPPGAAGGGKGEEGSRK
jgi:hypothetical protein